MIRLHYRSDLPMLATVGQDGEDIVVVVHTYAQIAFTAAERENLFNRLMRGIEAPNGATNDDVVVRLADRKERRAVCHALAEGLAVHF